MSYKKSYICWHNDCDADADTPSSSCISSNWCFAESIIHDTTATCSVFIRANKANDDISADISLWQGNSCIESWEASGSGTLNFESTATVSKGKSYTLKIDFSINGKIQPSVSHSNTCS